MSINSGYRKSLPQSTRTLEFPVAGRDGRTIWNGDGAPTDDIGAEGDFYFDKTNKFFYGPKGETTWPEGFAVSMVSASGLPFTFSTATTDADPGPGGIRFDNAAIGSVGNLYISTISEDGGDASAWLDSLDDSTTSGSKGLLYLQHIGVAGKWTAFSVAGSVITAVGYRKVPVVYRGGSFPQSTQRLGLTFAPQGSVGGSFIYGTGVPDAGIGAIGDVYLDVVTGNFYGPKVAGGWGGATASGLSTFVSLAQDWATKTSAEVVVGQGYGAKKYALDAATSATTAADSVATITPTISIDTTDTIGGLFVIDGANNNLASLYGPAGEFRRGNFLLSPNFLTGGFAITSASDGTAIISFVPGQGPTVNDVQFAPEPSDVVGVGLGDGSGVLRLWEVSPSGEILGNFRSTQEDIKHAFTGSEIAEIDADAKAATERYKRRKAIQFQGNKLGYTNQHVYTGESFMAEIWGTFSVPAERSAPFPNAEAYMLGQSSAGGDDTSTLPSGQSALTEWQPIGDSTLRPLGSGVLSLDSPSVLLTSEQELALDPDQASPTFALNRAPQIPVTRAYQQEWSRRLRLPPTGAYGSAYAAPTTVHQKLNVSSGKTREILGDGGAGAPPGSTAKSNTNFFNQMKNGTSKLITAAAADAHFVDKPVRCVSVFEDLGRNNMGGVWDGDGTDDVFDSNPKFYKLATVKQIENHYEKVCKGVLGQEEMPVWYFIVPGGAYTKDVSYDKGQIFDAVNDLDEMPNCVVVGPDHQYVNLNHLLPNGNRAKGAKVGHVSDAIEHGEGFIGVKRWKYYWRQDEILLVYLSETGLTFAAGYDQRTPRLFADLGLNIIDQAGTPIPFIVTGIPRAAKNQLVIRVKLAYVPTTLPKVGYANDNSVHAGIGNICNTRGADDAYFSYYYNVQDNISPLDGALPAPWALGNKLPLRDWLPPHSYIDCIERYAA